MKHLKRIILVFLVVLCLNIFGCESTNDIRCASFTNITQPGSDKNTVKITFEKDSRVDEKYVDIQIKSDKEVNVLFNKENEESLTLNFDNEAYNSLATLITNAKNEPDKEDFEKYKEIHSETLIFTCEEEITLTFKVVVGEKSPNATGTGHILTNSKEVSKEFGLKLNKKKN